MNNSLPDLNDLLAQKAALDQKIIEAQRARKAEAIAQVRALMAEYGLSLADLGTRVAAAPRKSAAKVAPKYRNPATGDTWSGRGLQPNWLKAAVAGGSRLEDFKV